MFFRKIAAFIKKDFNIEISYKLNFILNWVNIVNQVVIFYFISKLFGRSPTSYLNEYGGDFFSFILVGLVLSGYFLIALRSLSMHIREEQMLGTLEAIFLTPTKASVLVISLVCWDFVIGLINAGIYLLVGIGFLRVKLSGVDFFAVSTILILTVVSFSSIGILSAAFTIVLKKGDPIAWTIGIISVFFGGAYFPINILPQKLKLISYCLPITYSLRSFRYVLLKGYSFKAVSSDLVILLLFCIILFPLSIWAFKFAVRKAKLAGTLAHY